MRRMNQDLPEGQDGLVTGRILADLRGMIWHRIGPKGDFEALAVKAGVARSTIINLMFVDEKGHQTKRPHFETVARLAFALDRFDLILGLFSGDHRPVRPGRKRPKS